MNEADKLLQNNHSKNKSNVSGKNKESLDREFENEFTVRFTNLEEDIQNVDSRMAHLNKFIVNMETQVNNLRALIANDTNSSKRGSYYTLMNTCVELNARYEELYLKCMDLKYKYRKEQDDLSHKVKKLTHLDIPKMKNDNKDDGAGELSAGRLATLLQGLSEKLSATESDAIGIKQTLNDLDNDPDLRI